MVKTWRSSTGVNIFGKPIGATVADTSNASMLFLLSTANITQRGGVWKANLSVGGLRALRVSVSFCGSIWNSRHLLVERITGETFWLFRFDAVGYGSDNATVTHSPLAFRAAAFSQRGSEMSYLCGRLFSYQGPPSPRSAQTVWLPSASSFRTVHCLYLSVSLYLSLWLTWMATQKRNNKKKICKWKSPAMSSVYGHFFVSQDEREMDCTMTIMWNRQSFKWKRTLPSGEELASAGRDLFCSQVQFGSESARRASAEVISETCVTSPGERERK